MPALASAERGLTPLSSQSLDNLPNPVVSSSNPYVPTNRPAIGDLFDLFDLFNFSAAQQKPAAPPRPHGGQATSSRQVYVPNFAR